MYDIFYLYFQTSKNFIITLKNPSLGAKIGEHGAAVAYIKKGKPRSWTDLALLQGVPKGGLSYLLMDTSGVACICNWFYRLFSVK